MRQQSFRLGEACHERLAHDHRAAVCLRQALDPRSHVDRVGEDVTLPPLNFAHDPQAQAASDNEARSASLFRELAGPVMTNRQRLDDVERLILVTRFGEVPRRDDEAYMADIDYSSFGLPWGQFYADSLAVRAERPDLSDEQFAGQQSRFLAHLLDRETLYRTKFFRSLYEDVARANIARYVRMLGATEPGQ